MAGFSLGLRLGLGITSGQGGGIPANALTNKSGSMVLTNKSGTLILTRKAA
jgi:hypothetical protein